MEDRTSLTKLMDSTVWIAGGSLLLYMVSANYLSGYLAFYSARADWFNPALFQLVSFAFWPILFAILLGAAFQLLQMPRLTYSMTWYTGYALWLGIVGIIFFLDLRGNAVYFVNVAGSYRHTLLAWGLLAVLPLCSNLGAKYFAWKLKRAAHQPSKTSAALSPEVSAMVLRVGVGLTFLWNLTTISQQVGWASAMVNHDSRAYRFTYAADDDEKRIDLIFTDGTSSLTWESKGKIENIYYRNPTSGNALLLQTPVQMLNNILKKRDAAIDAYNTTTATRPTTSAGATQSSIATVPATQ